MAKKKPEVPAAPPELSRFQKWTPKRVHRKQLLNAPYNPRSLSVDAKKRLKRLIEKHGLLEGIVWNIRSGNIVGGHQRISIIDDLHGTDNYLLDVCQVDLDSKQEKEANIALNNPMAQGEFLMEKLEAVYKSEKGGLDIEATGFNTADIYNIFGGDPLIDQPEELEKLAESYRKMREDHERVMKSLESRDDPDFYAVLVFKTNLHRQVFMNLLGLVDDRIADGRTIFEQIFPALDLVALAAKWATAGASEGAAFPCDHCKAIQWCDAGAAETVCVRCGKTFALDWTEEVKARKARKDAEGAAAGPSPEEVQKALSAADAALDSRSDGVNSPAGV